MSRTTYFVDVIIPLALPNKFTYRVPVELNDEIAIGQRVIVQFGKQKVYTALVYSIHENIPQHYEAKYVLAILDDKPIVNQTQFDFWHWIASYYMCNIGEVMNAALPAALKLSSETQIGLIENMDLDAIALSEKERIIANALTEKPTLVLNEINSLLDQKTVYPYIQSLLEKNIIYIQENLQERYKPKLESYIRLTKTYQNQEALEPLFDKLKKAEKQVSTLMCYLQLSAFFTKDPKEVKKANLVNGGGSAIKALIDKGVFEQYEIEVGRIDTSEKETIPPVTLNDAQAIAYDEIRAGFEAKDVVLLNGITSSGKTEIYIHLIAEQLKLGKQVLYLLPEIALTTQIISRLKRFFGNKVYVYHSRFNDNEKVETWKLVLKTNENSDDACIILGPRSALFLPFEKLGLIIVDEEHESSFKQQNPSPRYNARDSAIYLSNLHKAKVLLGSATPSVESYFNARNGKYALVELMHRYQNISLPKTIIVDVQTDYKKKRMKSHFSDTLLEAIRTALYNKEQVILFQNRRGFSTILECESCSWVPQCKNCDVTLTYHKQINQLKCHYCGYSIEPPHKCNACGDTSIKMKGLGTERIEEDLAILIPEANIKRLDLDTTRSKYAYHNIITDFEDRKIDILVGTQMVTKGLDFDNVSLVGILNADNMLNFPDFRAYERSYQLMVQVSGRAGRKNKQGTVIIQSFNPEHSIIKFVMENDFQGMIHEELLHRKNFRYPPYYRLIQVTLRHKNIYSLNTAAQSLANDFRNYFGDDLLGPEFPAISRVKNLYIKNILIKIDRSRSVGKSKELISEAITRFKIKAENKSVMIQIDVDPN